MDNKYKGSFVALITPFVNGKSELPRTSPDIHSSTT